MIFSSLAASAMLVALAACGENGSDPTPAPGGGGQTITGTERLGWDIEAADAAALSQIRYAIYVDSVRSELNGVACTPPAGAAGFPCSAGLPALTPGQHTIELASFMVAGGTIFESAKSPPLVVTVGSGAQTGAGAGPVGPPDDSPVRDRTIVTADGIHLALRVGPERFDEPTDVAIAPDGRLLVAERAGRVQLITSNGAEAEPETALALEDVHYGSARGGLLALALSPTFSEDSLAYLLYTASGANGPVFRVARFREVNGRLAERAILLDNVDASPADPAGSLRFGADGRMYLGFDDGGDPAEARRAGSFNGKILRLNADGTTPVDRGTTDPVYSAGYRAPRGFDWHPVTGALWLIDARPEGERVAPAAVEPHVVRRLAVERATVLPRHTGASAIVAYGSAGIPAMRGNLLVAAASGNLLRLRLDAGSSRSVRSIEPLLPEGLGPVRALTVAPDGTIVAVGASLITLAPVQSR